MAQPTKTVSAPKVHPFIVGGIAGLIGAIIEVIIVQINHKAFSSQQWWMSLIGVLVPFVLTFWAGHYAGRHQRLNILQTTVTTGVSSTLTGTGTGVIGGIVFVILSQLSQQLTFLPYHPNNSSAFGAVLGGLGLIGGLLGWIFGGLILGTFGGILGDSRAHKQLKSGAVVQK